MYVGIKTNLQELIGHYLYQGKISYFFDDTSCDGQIEGDLWSQCLNFLLWWIVWEIRTISGFICLLHDLKPLK